jgi:hypothetical protein
MAIPPRGDPSRPVALAASAARTLGIVCLLLGGLIACATFMFLARMPGTSPTWVFMLLSAGLFIVPGVCYFVFASAVARYRMWGAICCLVFAGLQGLFLLLSMLGNVLAGRAGTSLVFYALALAVCVLLIVYTAQAIPVIRRDAGYRPSGFEPILTSSAPTAYPARPAGYPPDALPPTVPPPPTPPAV